MLKSVFKELLPINLIIFMLAMGIQYYKAAPRQVPVELITNGTPAVSAPHAFWVFPVIACIAYIVLTVLQFFHERLFLPKTFLIFFLANLHVAVLYYKTGEVDSLLLAMIPSALALVVYLVVVLFKRADSGPGNLPPSA